jgi:putative membrane protein
VIAARAEPAIVPEPAPGSASEPSPPGRIGAHSPLPWTLAAAAVLAEVAYPLVHGHARDALTVVTVVLFASAVIADAVVCAGPRAGTLLPVVTVAVGFGVEVLGVHTGVPFGHYRYRGTLGAELAGVPLVVPLAWTMLAWPALAVGRRIGRTPAAVAMAGGCALASWDLFLDPQMVHDGHWEWTGPAPRINGVPLVNHLGWLAVAVVLCAVLDAVLVRARDDAQPLLLWWWTFASSVLANVAFFGRPGVALAGGAGMGAVALLLVRARPPQRSAP